MKQLKPVCIWPVEAKLGEGPFWHPAEQALYLVDIKQRKLHRCDANGAARHSWSTPDEIGFALPMRGGGLVCGLPGRLVRFSPEDASFTHLCRVDSDIPTNRCNDAYVAPDGALWFGTMDNGESAPTGSLYRYEGEGAPRREDGGISITNGPCLSPDGKTFYHTDTLGGLLYAFDHGPDGKLSNRRVLIEFQGSGHPDGTVVDAEGCLWVGIFAGWRIERYAPDGRKLGEIAMPCANITKVAFGGADLRTLFVSTAWKGLSDAERAEQPLAGGVFRIDGAGVAGLPQHTFLLDETA